MFKSFLGILFLFFFSLQAHSAVRDIHVGGGNSNFPTSGQDIYGIGYGVMGYLDNGVMGGVSLDFEFINTPIDSSFAYGGDVKLGYSLTPTIAMYGIGACLTQDYDSTTGYGFGYGGGAEYRATPLLTVVAEYKTYAMQNKFTSYDFDSTQIKLRLNF